MSSKVVVPFNFQPVSVTTYTTTYTIPTGFYAYVTAFCEDGATFSVNGNIVLSSKPQIVSTGTGYDTNNVNLSSGSTNSAYSYTVPVGYKFQIHAAEISGLNSGGGTLSIHSGEVVVGSMSAASNKIFSAHANGASTIELAEGNVVAVNHSANLAFTKELWGKLERNNTINSGQQGTSLTANYWLPSGSLLETFNGKFTVSLYSNIS